MWFLVVAVFTMSGQSRTEVFMERGFTTEANCARAAERYKALEKFSKPGRRVEVDTRCEFQP